MKARYAVVAAAGLVLLLGDTGGAYWLSGQRWPAGATIVMHLEQGSSSGALTDGSADWDAVTESALATWNPFLNGTSFRAVRDSSNAALRNGANNVTFGRDVYGQPWGSGVLAITEYLYRTNDNVMTEADVIFNSSFNWNSYRGNLRGASGGGTLYDLRRVALHEFGHVIGLDHPDEHGQSVSAIMNSHASNVDSLQADDTSGAAAIYGAAPGAAASPTDTLSSGARLLQGKALTSLNGRYRLLYQVDGNLVLYDDVNRAPVWASNTGGTTPGFVAVQGDGNVVIYNSAGVPQWATGTANNAGARLVVQGDGNVVLYRPDGQPAWDRVSSTAGGS